MLLKVEWPHHIFYYDNVIYLIEGLDEYLKKIEIIL